MAKACNTNQKTIFSRVKKLPSRLVPGTVYIVSNGVDEFVDMYVADNKGNKKSIVDSSRFSDIIIPEEGSPLENYLSDINNIGLDYYYGYEYKDSTFKIIKVEKGNIVNQKKAINTSGTFITNWNNRESLTYN